MATIEGSDAPQQVSPVYVQLAGLELALSQANEERCRLLDRLGPILGPDRSPDCEVEAQPPSEKSPLTDKLETYINQLKGITRNYQELRERLEV